jgi:hypothetical protein
MLIRVGCIPLVPRKDWEKVPKQELHFVKADGSKYKRKVQIASEEDPTLIIRVIKEIIGVHDEIGMDGGVATVTRSKKSSLRLCLSGAPRDRWDEAAAGKPDTAAGWNAAIRAFLVLFMELDEDWRRQVDYVTTLKMPKDTTYGNVVSLLSNMHSLMQWIPETGIAVYPKPAVYNEEQAKQLLLRMMPDQLRNEFEKQSLTAPLAVIDLLSLSRWLDRIAATTTKWLPAADDGGGSRRNHSSKKKSNNGGSNNGNGGGDGNGGGSGKGKNRRGRNGKNKGKGKDAKCPYHGGHLWENCFGNKDGPKYKEGFKLPNKKLKTSDDDEDRDDNHVIIDVPTSPKGKKTKVKAKASPKAPKVAFSPSAKKETEEDECFWDQVIGDSESENES